MVAVLSGFGQSAGARGSPFAERWIDAAHGSEPQLQVQRYDDDTYILRQSIKTNVEAKGLKSLQLIVAHSHSHEDHIAGDEEFTGRPDTRVVGHSPERVAAFFEIHSWPDQIAQFSGM
jgi:glyoxylase-like metal-dependent hydrolase (beta-lactamase superfamily II)